MCVKKGISAPPRTTVNCPKCLAVRSVVDGHIILSCQACGNTSFNDTEQLIGLLKVNGVLVYSDYYSGKTRPCNL